MDWPAPLKVAFPRKLKIGPFFVFDGPDRITIRAGGRSLLKTLGLLSIGGAPGLAAVAVFRFYAGFAWPPRHLGMGV